MVVDVRSGRPYMQHKRMTALLKQDRRKTCRLAAERLNTLKPIVQQILKEDLDKRKMCCRFVPHALTSEQ